MSFTSV